MSILERLYSSGGREVELETLAVQVGAQTFYLTKGWDDFTARLETGEAATFTACGMDIAKPARNADGVQDLRFALSNLNGVVSTQLRAALAAKQEMVATFRLYLSTDLLAPAERPFSVKVKGGKWTATEVQINAGFMTVLDTEWPRNRYVLSKHPGLRYM
ncbi:TPA: DUF1833 family protein [Stenotrophomonas maltophilia]